MTNRLFIIIVLFFLITGCAQLEEPPVAIEIDGIKITAYEFEEAYKNSFYSREDSSSSRRAFLDNLVLRRLILREAERQNLDKDPSFLKDVEFFWQQSLLKSMLDKKSRELSLDLKVSDKEIIDYYQGHKDSDFKDKELADAYGKIQLLLLREKEQGAINDWVDSLKKKTRVKINYKLLNISEK